jgi:hypothetical protein
MNTVVWIMVMFTYGSNVNTGSEFSSLEKCQRAADVITQSANDRMTIISGIRKPWCVRIEK